MDVDLFYDPDMIDHDPGPRHPERPERLESIVEGLESVEAGLRWWEPELVEDARFELVHRPSYVADIVGSAGSSRQLDPDTRTSAGSVRAARLASGAVCEAVESTDERDEASFALVRPPGHHAERAQAMGFCLFNNVAIGAEWALEEVDGVERVAVVDWDVHHGNGTEQAFREREDVLFVSSHQFPFYPGTGDRETVGDGGGEGRTVNVALPGGLGDGDYAAAYAEVVEPVVRQFDPDLILVSAGFDAHTDDPLAGMQVSTGGFAHLCGRLRDLAEEVADGRLAATLEGGYDLEALADSVAACVEVLGGRETPVVTDEPSSAGREAIDDIVRIQSRFWDL